MLKTFTIPMAAVFVLTAAGGSLRAEEPYGPYEERGAVPGTGFVEGTGSYGLQIGNTEYLPDGALNDYKFPWVYGWAVGGTLGLNLGDGLALIANYEYTDARSRSGGVPMVLDKVKGRITYHSLVAGLRVSTPAGLGRVRAEVAGGVVFPFQQKTNFHYGAGLAQLPEPITGEGHMIEKFNYGYGGHGLVGYEFPVSQYAYLALSIKLKVFQSNNHDKNTKFRNFVVDFEADAPTAVTADVRNGDGGQRPFTNAVADARGQLAIGVRF